MKRKWIILLAALLIAVPPLEYWQWQRDIAGLVPETGRITGIRKERCRVRASSRRSFCSYATIEYPISAMTIGVLEPHSAIRSRYQIGDSIALLVDPQNRQRAQVAERNGTLFGFLGVPSTFAMVALVVLLVASRFFRPNGRHRAGD